MNDRVKYLDIEAGKLTPEERFELVERILANAHSVDPANDAAWQSEARDRLEGWRRGELASRPLDDALAKHAKR